LPFPTLLQRFAERAPLCVLARALLERALQPDPLDRLFDELATVQYTRELLFSSVVDLLTQVALRAFPSVRQAYRDDPQRYGVSLAAVYAKLNHLEPPLGPALVRYSAGQMRAVITALGAALPPWRDGYRVKILDGNHLSGTHHRLAPLRATAAAPLPGQVLAVLDPQARLFLDLVACEDAYTQERALLDQVVPLVEANDVWVGDRNLCTPKFLVGIADRGGCFAIREHAQLNIRYEGALRPAGRSATGAVFEQDAEVTDDATGRSVRVRRVVVALDKPTRDGDSEVAVLTNLPADVADALAVADLYLTRWTIEVCFGELTTALRCEVAALGYPRAALFSFAVAAFAGNVFGAVRAALRAVHGADRVEAELSVPQVALDVAGAYQGMMIALPPAEWAPFAALPVPAFAEALRAVARRVNWDRVKKTTRGPKKPPPKRPSASKQRHVSTARLLQSRQNR
jgi:Transposase DDE domain